MTMEYMCPICGKLMTEEEGLYWCDNCGINNDSISYKLAMEKMRKEVDCERE